MNRQIIPIGWNLLRMLGDGCGKWSIPSFGQAISARDASAFENIRKYRGNLLRSVPSLFLRKFFEFSFFVFISHEFMLHLGCI